MSKPKLKTCPHGKDCNALGCDHKKMHIEEEYCDTYCERYDEEFCCKDATLAEQAAYRILHGRICE